MLAKLNSKYANASVKLLLRKATFADPHHCGKYDNSVNDTKREIETELVILARETEGSRAEEGENTQHDMVQQPAKKKPLLASILVRTSTRKVTTVAERAQAEQHMHKRRRTMPRKTPLNGGS